MYMWQHTQYAQHAWHVQAQSNPLYFALWVQEGVLRLAPPSPAKHEYTDKDRIVVIASG